MKMRFALVALPLLLSACVAGDMPWAKKPAEPAAPTAPAASAEPPKPKIPEPTGASPVDQPLQVEGQTTARATVNATTNAISNLAAEGQGWSAAVRGNTARFTGGATKGAAISVRRISYSGGLEYVGKLNDKPFTLNVAAKDCGGKPLTATVRANGQRLTGCATPITAAEAAAAVPKAAAPEAAAPAATPKKKKTAPKPAAASTKTETPKAEPAKVEPTKPETAAPTTPAPSAAEPAKPAVTLPPLVLPTTPPALTGTN